MLLKETSLARKSWKLIFYFIIIHFLLN